MDHPLPLPPKLSWALLPSFILHSWKYLPPDSTCAEPMSAPQHEETSPSLELSHNLCHNSNEFPGLLLDPSKQWLCLVAYLECLPPSFLIHPLYLRPHGPV